MVKCDNLIQFMVTILRQLSHQSYINMFLMIVKLLFFYQQDTMLQSCILVVCNICRLPNYTQKCYNLYRITIDRFDVNIDFVFLYFGNFAS